MKKIYALEVICLLATFFTAIANENYQFAHPNPPQTVASFHYIQPVSTTQFRKKGDVSLLQTFTITDPGTYTFVEDINFQGIHYNTTTAASCALFVASDNVIIDLGCKTLFQTNENTGIRGIEIRSGQKNITIKNGNLVGHSGAGILVNSGCDSIRIQNITVSNCTERGIAFAGTDDEPITNCALENILISKTYAFPETSLVAGIELSFCCNSTICDAAFGNSTGTTTITAAGALINSCCNIVFDYCDASNNEGANGYGFQIINGISASSFSHCSAHANKGSNILGGIGFGFSLESAEATFLTCCSARNNTGTKSGIGFQSYSVSYSTFLECTSINNKADSLAIDQVVQGGKGFNSCSGLGNNYQNCTATGNCGNTASFRSVGAGFTFSQEKYTTLNECSASHNGSDTACGWGIGIYLMQAKQMTIKNCHIMNNRSSQENHGCGLLETTAESTTLVTDCLLFGNGAGSTIRNTQIAYPSGGTLHVAKIPTVGHMKNMIAHRPFQNISIAVI